MAAPTAPTLTSITTEGIRRAGHSSPTTAQLTRAQDEWMAEIKNDIFMAVKGLKFLMASSVAVTTNGQARYSMPTDHSSDLAITLLDGNNTGTCTGGAAGTVTLASAETYTEADLLGKEVLMYEGTSKGSLSQITAYNSTSKVATVTPNFTTAPASGDKYMFIDTYSDVAVDAMWKYDREPRNFERGMPTKAYIPGDADYGEFILSPTPYKADGKPYGLRMRYCVNLLTLDLAGTHISTLYHRWRNVWTQGIYAKQLQNDDDNRAASELQKYTAMVAGLQLREVYGNDISNLQCTVGD